MFGKLDCSEAYHCVQIADDLSVQLLGFNFASRAIAYNCLAQGLNKSVAGFSSFIKHFLDPCLAAIVCMQFMDDIAAAVSSFDEMITALGKLFDCLRQSGLKLSARKCEYGTIKIDCLGSTVAPKGIPTESAKIGNFLGQIRMPNTVELVKHLIGFVQFSKLLFLILDEKFWHFINFYAKKTFLHLRMIIMNLLTL